MGNILSKLDQTDKKILNILQKDARITNTNLAKAIGLSAGPTLERVKKLEKSGLILRYSAELNKDLIGLKVNIFIMASLSASRKSLMNSFVEKINNIPEITECHHLTGAADFLIKIRTESIDTYNKFILDKLIDIEEIANMQSMVVLSSIKEDRSIHLD